MVMQQVDEIFHGPDLERMNRVRCRFIHSTGTAA